MGTLKGGGGEIEGRGLGVMPAEEQMGQRDRNGGCSKALTQQ